jgi:hypothetical protein
MQRIRDQDEGQYVLSLFQKVAAVPTTVWQDRIEDARTWLSPAIVGAAVRRAIAMVRR